MIAALTINIDPEFHLGPLTLSWHGLTIALGIAVGGWVATRYARQRGLDPEVVLNALLVIALAGIVGARLFFLLENDPGALLKPGELIGTRGFSFYGAMILGTVAVAVYLRRSNLDVRYLDALAAGFPLGMAIGRIGDLINGEHYGPQSDLPWAVRYTHPEADVPSSAVAYHSGGLYEIVLALVMLALTLPLWGRLRRPGMLLWAVIALYGAGRFLMFFYRDDSEGGTLGLNGAQWTSVLLVALAGAGALWSRRQDPAGGPEGPQAEPRRA